MKFPTSVPSSCVLNCVEEALLEFPIDVPEHRTQLRRLMLTGQLRPRSKRDSAVTVSGETADTSSSFQHVLWFLNALVDLFWSFVQEPLNMLEETS